ncbi:MAG: class I adenylate-forming enzyme family protein, partial [Shewanella sp.]
MQRVTIISPLHQAAKTHPHSIAISWCDQKNRIRLSYAQLSRIIINLGEQLHTLGLSRGHRLACIDSNSIELVILYWACIDQGVLFCPLSPRFPPVQIIELVNRYALSHVWAGEQHQHLLTQDLSYKATSLNISLNFSLTKHTQPAPPKLDTKLAVNIILTSGSSGPPKAALHSLNNHIANAEGSRSFIPLEP